MKHVKKMDQKVVCEAARILNKAGNTVNEVVQQHRNEMDMIFARGIDQRDISDLALFIKYEHKYDGTNGRELTEEEHRKETENIIKAFINDDREKMFNYLDRWYKFCEKYEADEEITTIDQSIKNRIFLRAQQGLGVSKLREYPDYVKSRFPDFSSLMRMQEVQNKLTEQSLNDDILLHEMGLGIYISSIETLDRINALSEEEAAVSPERTKLIMEGEAYKLNAPSMLRQGELTDVLMDAFDYKSPSITDNATIKKITLPKWLEDRKGTDYDGRENSDFRGEVQSGFRAAIGSTQTGFGKILEYTNLLDIGMYKFIFVDGVSVYDSIGEPKDIKNAQAALMKAMCDETGVVSVAQVAEIDGKFEYRMDILDTSNGVNDNPEYLQKLEALKDENARKALFDAKTKELTDFFEKARKDTIEKNRARYESDAKTELDNYEVVRRYANGVPQDFGKEGVDEDELTFEKFEDLPKPIQRLINKSQPQYTVDKKNLRFACFTIDEARRQFLSYARKTIYGSKYNKKLDARDYQDMMIFTKFAKTFGVGDKDLTDEEFRVESEKMLTATINNDHAGLKPYLDRMYNFLENYKAPEKNEDIHDIMRTLMFLRMQQGSTVKLHENPWYRGMRCPTTIEQARFSTYEADYYTNHLDVEHSLGEQLGVNIASGDFTRSLSNMYYPRQDDSFDLKYSNVSEDITSYKMREYQHVAKKYIADRRYRTNHRDEFEVKNTYKMALPNSAMAKFGKEIDNSILNDEAYNMEAGLFQIVYGGDFMDSQTLRKFGFQNQSSNDNYRLIYVDGVSIYDMVKEDDKPFNSKKARGILFDNLVNQKGVVQFAHILEGKDGDVEVELNTIDVSNSFINSPEYAGKLAECEKNIDERYNAIKTQINTICKESKRQLDTRTYYAEASQDEQDFFGLGDVFETQDFDVNKVVKNETKLEKAFRFNRSAVISSYLNELTSLTHADINVGQFIDKAEELFNNKQFSVKDYNKLWQDLWSSAMKGLKDIAAQDKYERKVPFAYATNMVERLMKGTAKLYDIDDSKIPTLGGMTTEKMVGELKKDVPTWEERHFDEYVARTGGQNAKISLIAADYKLSAWKKISMEEFKTMEGFKEFDQYRDKISGELNAEGKRLAALALVEFHDRINVMARNLRDDKIFNVDPEKLKKEMIDFAGEIKKVAIEINGLDEESLNKLCGDGLVLEDSIDAFEKSVDNVFKIDKSLKAESDAKKKKEQQQQIEKQVAEDKKDVNSNVIKSLPENEEIINTDSKNNENQLEDSKVSIKPAELFDGAIHRIYGDSVDEFDVDNDINVRNGIDNEFYSEIDDSASLENEVEEDLDIPDDIIGVDKDDIENIDLYDYKGGRYTDDKMRPNSSYAIASHGALSNLSAAFGSLDNERTVPKFVDFKDNSEKTEVDEEIFKDFKKSYGVSIDSEQLVDAINRMLEDNSSFDEKSVDMSMFERQYKMLFNDLFNDTLGKINKYNAKIGKVMSFGQVNGALNMLNKVMKNACGATVCPKTIENGGLTNKEIKGVLNSFIDTNVAKNSEEMALRSMQANDSNFDFDNVNWKNNLGYSAFSDLMHNEINNLMGMGGINAGDPQVQYSVAQKYRAMRMYNQRRSRWSRFWNWRKSKRERNVAEIYKERAMLKFNLTEREFNDLLGVQKLNDVDKIKDVIDKKFNDNNLINKNKQSEQSISEDSMSERISVTEADHKRKFEKEKIAEKKEVERNLENSIK